MAKTEPEHIIVVDDEPGMREALNEYLSLRGYRVTEAGDGAKLRSILQSDSARLVLLDLGLPGENGVELARYLKELGNIGVIMVTAHGESEDRVLGLETGADDYIVKPFNFRELLARVRSVLRRIDAASGDSSATAGSEVVNVGHLTYDRMRRTLNDADGSEVPLTAGELDLLTVLLDHPNRAISRDELLEKSSHRDWEPFDRSVDVRITRLRRKIEIEPTKPRIIRTVRGVGYMFKTDSTD